MPAKPTWLLQIPAILTILEQWPAPWLDRPAIEALFGLKRRRAIQLLHAFGGFQVGRTFLVERKDVIKHLRKVLDGEEFDWEHKRRRRVSEALSTARSQSQAAQVPIPLLPLSPAPALPAGVELQPGRLVIAFEDVTDLLAKFYALSQAAATDFAWFQQAVRCAAPPTVPPRKPANK